MKKIMAFLLVLLLMAFQAAQAYYGTRPMGMGGAFTAIADDANAAYWNPAGFAINPGVDLSGSLLVNNRNEKIGDNLASFKMCFETELHPLAWIIGVGAASFVALEGAKYLHDQGIVEKGWGRKVEKVSKEEGVAEGVLVKGTTKTVDVAGKAKQKVKEVGKEVYSKTKEVGKKVGKVAVEAAAAAAGREAVRQSYWGPYYAPPWYCHNYRRPTYWDNRRYEKEYSPQGKAQFAAGFSLMTDKNANLNQDTNHFMFSLATGYEERIAFGGNLNIYDIALTNVTPNLKGYGAGFDVGALLRPVDEVAFGLKIEELLTTDIHFENNSVISYKMKVNAGAAITPWEPITIATDVHNAFRQSGDPATMHYGVEVRPFPGIALRAGLHDESKTAGLSIGAYGFIFDYAYLGGTFNRTQMAGLTWKL